MDDEAYKKLARENLGFKCLKCTSFDVMEQRCKDNKAPLTCGRGFNPKGGLGEKVPA